jgi:hypothetical protein
MISRKKSCHKLGCSHRLDLELFQFSTLRMLWHNIYRRMQRQVKSRLARLSSVVTSLWRRRAKSLFDMVRDNGETVRRQGACPIKKNLSKTMDMAPATLSHSKGVDLIA